MPDISELSGKVLLLADPDDQVRQVLRSGFEARNTVVYDAATLVEAIAQIQAGEVNLVISEVEFGAGSGFDLLAQVKAIEGRPLFVFLASDDDFRVRARAFAEGAEDYIIKPSPLDEIMLKSDRVMRLKRMGRPDIDFGGSLSVFSPEELVQLLEASRKTGEMEIMSTYGEAKVWFNEGKVVHADFIGIEGEEAIFLLFALGEGTFEFRVGVQAPAQTIQASAAMLLLEGLRMADETQALLSNRKPKGGQASDGTMMVGGDTPR
ncbi:MAG: response regulator [Planctomycetes bacterium]|nr:response regulator [Planctomycetota bacterium]